MPLNSALNRLTKASYGEKSGGGWNFGKYKVPKINYDYNGNITRLVRYGFCRRKSANQNRI